MTNLRWRMVEKTVKIMVEKMVKIMVEKTVRIQWLTVVDKVVNGGRNKKDEAVGFGAEKMKWWWEVGFGAEKMKRVIVRIAGKNDIYTLMMKWQNLHIVDLHLYI